MDLRSILDKFARGDLTVEQVQNQISLHSVEAVEDIAKQDIGREIRKGTPEVIFAESKEYADILKITTSVVGKKGRVVISRIRKKEVIRLSKDLKKKKLQVEVGKNSTTILAKDPSFAIKKTGAKIGIMAAGTSDIGVAEEARIIAEAMGCDVVAVYDVGVAGIHRLFPALKRMLAENVSAMVVVAGMEGALASVVSSMVDIPVVGVPTSVGYGFGGKGVTALAAMLQSCSLGLVVVNIDNGVGAGAFAALTANRTVREKNGIKSTPYKN